MRFVGLSIFQDHHDFTQQKNPDHNYSFQKNKTRIEHQNNTQMLILLGNVIIKKKKGMNKLPEEEKRKWRMRKMVKDRERDYHEARHCVFTLDMEKRSPPKMAGDYWTVITFSLSVFKP